MSLSTLSKSTAAHRPQPPQGVTTVRQLLDWANEQKRPPPAKALPHVALKYVLEDGTTLPVEELGVMDPGQSEDFAANVVLAGAAIKQEDSPRMSKKDKVDKAKFLIEVAGGPRKHHEASVALATSNAIKEAMQLRQLSLYDPICLEILSQSYVNHWYKKFEDALQNRKITTEKQIRTLRAPAMRVVQNAASLVTTIPIMLRVIALVDTYPMRDNLFFLYVLMNMVATIVAQLLKLTKGSDYWEKRQVLLHLPAAFMDFPHVREVVALNTEIKDVEKAFTFWVSLNPGDAGIWFAYTIRTQVQSAIFDYRTKQVTGGDDKENKNAAAGLSISASASSNVLAIQDDDDDGASVSSMMTTATGTGKGAKAKNKAKSMKTATAKAATGKQNESDNNKRQLAQRSPNGNQDDPGDKFLKATCDNKKENTVLSLLPFVDGKPTKYSLAEEGTEKENLSNAAKHLRCLRTIKEDEEEQAEKALASTEGLEVKPSFFEQYARTDKGKMMMELKEPLRQLAESHTDNVAAEAFKTLYDAWVKSDKQHELKLSTVVANSADAIRTSITNRSVLFFLLLVFPGMDLLQILSRDLAVFVIFGLPMEQILSMQTILRDALFRVSSGTGLRGDLLNMVIIKSQKVPGLNHMMDQVCGKAQGMEKVRKNFQELLRIPQTYHHMPVTDRPQYVNAAYQAVKAISEGTYSATLHHDVGVIYYCACYCVTLFQLLWGLRSLRAKKRADTAKDVSYEKVSAEESSIRSFRQNLETASAAKKLEAAIAKMKRDGLSKAEIALKKQNLDFKTPLGEDALEVFDLALTKLPEEIQRYGPLAAVLLDAIEFPSYNSLVKKPTYGSTPYCLGAKGQWQMNKIETIVKSSKKPEEKKAELQAIYNDLDNWGRELAENEGDEGLTEMEHEQVDDAEPEDELAQDEFAEEVTFGSLDKWVGSVFKKAM
eukprot:g10575.t1